MSTEIRKKYELKARAQSQRETRDRIAHVASQLHEEFGPAQTTVVEIARRAQVSRLTVYNHFPDLAALLPACAADYEARHPFPEFGSALLRADPTDRARDVLTLLYAWFRETEALWSKVFSDRTQLPELDEFVSNGIDQMLDDVASELSASLAADRAEAEGGRVLVRLAADFWTWRRLTRDGLDDAAAAGVMAGVLTRI